MNNYYIVQISNFSEESVIFQSAFKPNIKPLFLLVGKEEVLVIDNYMNAMQLKKDDDYSIEVALSWQDSEGKPHHLPLKRYAIADLCELIYP